MRWGLITVSNKGSSHQSTRIQPTETFMTAAYSSRASVGPDNQIPWAPVASPFRCLQSTWWPSANVLKLSSHLCACFLYTPGNRRAMS